MMVSFTTLPVELKCDILSHVAISDLLALLLVSKVMNQVGEQSLYQNIQLIWQRKRREVGKSVQQSSFRKLHTVLFNILRLPRRSTYVQHLQVDVGGLINVWGPPRGTKITQYEVDLSKSVIFGATPDSIRREQWLLNLIAGVPNAYIELLLVQTSNIWISNILVKKPELITVLDRT